MLDASSVRINPVSTSAQQSQQLTHAQLDVKKTGLNTGEPLHVSPLGMLLHELVRRIQGRRKQVQALLKLSLIHI